MMYACRYPGAILPGQNDQVMAAGAGAVAVRRTRPDVER